jgi:hypothetical protein
VNYIIQNCKESLKRKRVLINVKAKSIYLLDLWLHCRYFYIDKLFSTTNSIFKKYIRKEIFILLSEAKVWC